MIPQGLRVDHKMSLYVPEPVRAACADQPGQRVVLSLPVDALVSQDRTARMESSAEEGLLRKRTRTAGMTRVAVTRHAISPMTATTPNEKRARFWAKRSEP